MGKFIELIGQLKPKNDGNFPIADVNDLKGGYVQLENIGELESLVLLTDKLKDGMLAYISEDSVIYQIRKTSVNSWTYQVWNSGGGSGGGASIRKVEDLEDLKDPKVQIPGQIVYVESIKDIRYFDSLNWVSFSKIYIQPTEPEDKGGIWIDTSEDWEIDDYDKAPDTGKPEGVLSHMLSVINILQDKVNKLEWALETQLDFGDFKNNHYNTYNTYATPVKPGGEDEEVETEITPELPNRKEIEEIEPVHYNSKLPNAKHLSIKSGSYSEMIENANDFLPSELLWVEDRKQLWIKDALTNKLIQIGSQGNGGFDPIEPDPEIMKQIITDTDSGGREKIYGINFGDMADKDRRYEYQLRVIDGKLVLYDLKLEEVLINDIAQDPAPDLNNYYIKPYYPIVSGNSKSPLIYINSMYTGGKGTSKSYLPCSHNFVEISNLTELPLNLKGLYLHYTERGTGDWVTLPLKGVIEPSKTFLVRGSQCSVIDVNTTKIKVESYDMEWSRHNTLNPDVLDHVEYGNIWGTDGNIQFSENCSLYISGKDRDQSFDKGQPLHEKSPWLTGYVIKGYIDLVGVGSEDSTLPSEAAPYPVGSTDVLLHRVFTMDFVDQAIQTTDKRSNPKQWTHINLVNPNPRIVIEDYIPKASFEEKGFFFNKKLLKDGAPNIVTCSFGRDAHRTRCFNWVSKGYYDEFIWFSDESGVYEDESTMHESFKENDGRTSLKNWNDKIYNRIRSITTDGTAFTAHKFMIDFNEPTIENPERVVYYKVGRPGAWTEEKSFTLRNRDFVIEKGFDFLHHTDQQGFNAEEYETWRLAADYIGANKESNGFDFSINTGDATQNGNRINEWIDYFNYGEPIFKDKEQMYTVGNNDLAPKEEGVLGRGTDIDKMNPINVHYFFTFEHPNYIPKSMNGVYIPAVYSFTYGDTYFLSMNSEITDRTREHIYEEIHTENNVYLDQIKPWVEEDISTYGAKGDLKVKWMIAYTHESPFTMLTPEQMREYAGERVGDKYMKDEGRIAEGKDRYLRGGSHLNTIGGYWFSRFLEDEGVNLCLCGHKHTYSNSRYIRDNVRGLTDDWRTMEPFIYDPNYVPGEGDDNVGAVYPQWFTDIPELERQSGQLSSDDSLHFVKYVMSQATGFKLVSNKTMSGNNIPWLDTYYPVENQIYGDGGYSYTPNTAQLLPHYILWNVGKGTEGEEPGSVVEERPRIKGNSYKLSDKKISGKPWAYKYNDPLEYTDLERLGGNGDVKTDHNIIVEDLFGNK